MELLNVNSAVVIYAIYDTLRDHGRQGAAVLQDFNVERGQFTNGFGAFLILSGLRMLVDYVTITTTADVMSRLWNSGINPTIQEAGVVLFGGLIMGLRIIPEIIDANFPRGN